MINTSYLINRDDGHSPEYGDGCYKDDDGGGWGYGCNSGYSDGGGCGEGRSYCDSNSGAGHGCGYDCSYAYGYDCGVGISCCDYGNHGYGYGHACEE